MIIIYLSPSCTSCRKARAWLEEYEIPFDERNIMNDPPTKTELEKILSLTEKGTGDIISTRSQAFRKLDININELSLQELYELIHAHPEILRKPILIDQRRIQVGYNESEIRQFVPKKVRRHQLKKAKNKIAALENSAD